MKTSLRAFTLIELLLVVAIIAILASLVLVVIGMVRFSARKVACANNMRQLHLILVSHAHDHQGRLMQTPRLWNDSLRFPNAAYVKGPKADEAKELSMVSLDSYLDFKQSETYDVSYQFSRLMRLWVCPVDRTKTADAPEGHGFTVAEGNGNSYVNIRYTYLAGASAWSATEKEGCADVIADRGLESNRLLISDNVLRWSDQIWFINHYRSNYGSQLAIDRSLVRKALDGANQLFTDGHLRYKPVGEFLIDAMHDDTPGQPYARNTIDRWYF